MIRPTEGDVDRNEDAGDDLDNAAYLPWAQEFPIDRRKRTDLVKAGVIAAGAGHGGGMGGMY